MKFKRSCQSLQRILRTTLVALTFLSVVPSALAASFRAEDIRVEGLQRVSAGPAFAALPIRSGDVVTNDVVREIIQSLFATGFFSDVRVARDDNILIVTVVERPAITEVEIEGNKAIKTEQLTDVMTNNGLAEGEILQQETLDAILRELERQYVAQGRYSASVEADISDLPNNQVKVKVNVDEGKVASIKHINIVGNKVFSDEVLLPLFELKTTGLFSWIVSDDRYAKEKLKGDIEKLESHYLDRGYLDFKVVSSQISLNPDKSSVYITLNISEGEVYTVDDIELAGDPVLSEAMIMRLILLRKGDTFSQALMDTSSEYITERLGNAGYTNAEVKTVPEKSEEGSSVKIVFFIEPSQRVYVRRVEFRGNTATSDEVLRREMRQFEGSSASNARIEQGKIRLERLGFFKEVSVETKDVPGSSDLVDVEYTVEEQPSGSITASIGYSQGYGAMVQGSLQQKNWLGSGKQVGLSINHSDFQTSYSANYNDPFFTPDGVSRGISLYYQASDFGKINVSNYSTNSYGLAVSFGYPVSEIQRLSFEVGLRHLEIETGALAVQEIRRSPSQLYRDDYPNEFIYYEDNLDYIDTSRQLNGLYTYSLDRDPDGDGVIEDYSLETQQLTADLRPDIPPGFIDLHGDAFNSATAKLSWIRSTLNRGVLATRGTQNRLSLDFSLPGSGLEYYKLQYIGQYFQPLMRGLTLRLRTKIGYGDGYGDLERLPFFENFYGGGYGSIRGYRRNTFGPRSTAPSNVFSVGTEASAVDANGDGINESIAEEGEALIYCRGDGLGDGVGCNSLGIQTFGLLTSTSSVQSTRSFGGNMVAEFSAEFIFPIPFIEDQRSTQLAFFVDAGNVFDTDCRSTQANCNSFSPDRLNSSYGLNLTWISGMGPLTFSWARPIDYDQVARPESFQFNFGTGF